MTVWLDAEARPFYAGTYFPPRDGERGMRAGFLTLLRHLRSAHRTIGGSCRDAREISAALARALSTIGVARGPALPSSSVALASYRSRFDSQHGGMLAHRNFEQLADALVASRICAQRRCGRGAHGHGHARAHGARRDIRSDRRRLSSLRHRSRLARPHFEKMLYDNALLAVAYLEGFVVTRRADFAAVARDVLDYVAREMTASEGAFYSATMPTARRQRAAVRGLVLHLDAGRNRRRRRQRAGADRVALFRRQRGRKLRGPHGAPPAGPARLAGR